MADGLDDAAVQRLLQAAIVACTDTLHVDLCTTTYCGKGQASWYEYITRRPPQGLERQGRTRGYSYQRDWIKRMLTWKTHRTRLRTRPRRSRECTLQSL
eukprot:scaffold13216_cov69-Phaeocystis_antarctica.AAC.2